MLSLRGLHETGSVDLFKDSGSLDACRECSGSKCCGNIKHGGTIEPPFLTFFDVARISRATGLAADEFSDPVFNKVTGNHVRFLKTGSKHGCHFLEEGRCSIHNNRPIDCRLFPLDVKKLGGVLTWVIYEYEHCVLSDRDKDLLMKQVSPAMRVLEGELEDYATVPLSGMANIGYAVLGPVILNKETATA